MFFGVGVGGVVGVGVLVVVIVVVVVVVVVVGGGVVKLVLVLVRFCCYFFPYRSERDYLTWYLVLWYYDDQIDATVVISSCLAPKNVIAVPERLLVMTSQGLLFAGRATIWIGLLLSGLCTGQTSSRGSDLVRVTRPDP